MSALHIRIVMRRAAYSFVLQLTDRVWRFFEIALSRVTRGIISVPNTYASPATACTGDCGQNIQLW
jgi:hypothetical protein